MKWFDDWNLLSQTPSSWGRREAVPESGGRLWMKLQNSYSTLVSPTPDLHRYINLGAPLFLQHLQGAWPGVLPAPSHFSLSTPFPPLPSTLAIHSLNHSLEFPRFLNVLLFSFTILTPLYSWATPRTLLFTPQFYSCFKSRLRCHFLQEAFSDTNYILFWTRLYALLQSP